MLGRSADRDLAGLQVGWEQGKDFPNSPDEGTGSIRQRVFRASFRKQAQISVLI